MKKKVSVDSLTMDMIKPLGNFKKIQERLNQKKQEDLYEKNKNVPVKKSNSKKTQPIFSKKIKRSKKIPLKKVKSKKQQISAEIIKRSKNIPDIIEIKRDNDPKPKFEVPADKEKKKQNLKKTKNESVKKTRNLKRVPSGIPGFDRLIQGGFEEESVNIVVGNSGSGKTIFTMQFLIEGMKRGESTLYITFEEKEEFYRNMLDFGWDLEELEKKGKFVFLEYSPEKVKMMLEEGGGEIESIVIKNGIKLLVIDSMTSFSLLFDDELSKRQAALGLFDLMRKWSCTSLLTLQENPENRKTENLSSVEFEADSIILLYFVRVEKTRERFVEVLKMRGTKHSTEVYPFWIKNGIEVGDKNIVFKY